MPTQLTQKSSPSCSVPNLLIDDTILICQEEEIQLLFSQGRQITRSRVLFGICLYRACRINEACTVTYSYTVGFSSRTMNLKNSSILASWAFYSMEDAQPYSLNVDCCVHISVKYNATVRTFMYSNIKSFRNTSEGIASRQSRRAQSGASIGILEKEGQLQLLPT